MKFVNSTVLFGTLLAFGLGAGVAAHAGDELVRNSPFIPQGWQPPRAPERPTPRPTPERPQDRPLDRVEFRGMTVLFGERSFSIHDPSSNRSFWLREGQGEAGFRVVEFNPGDDAVIVEHDGERRTIPLHEAKVAAVEQPRQAPRPTGGTRPQATRGPTRQVEQDPEERMQNLAEEIRRRRELRRQILERSESGEEPQQQETGGVPVPPGP